MTAIPSPAASRASTPAPAEASAHTAPTVALGEATFADEIERHPGLALVDFWAPWCGPCRILSPVVEQIARERAGHLKVATLDVDAHPRLAARFQVRGVPTLLVFRDGVPVAQLVGVVPKARIEAALDAHA